MAAQRFEQVCLISKYMLLPLDHTESLRKHICGSGSHMAIECDSVSCWKRGSYKSIELWLESKLQASFCRFPTHKNFLAVRGPLFKLLKVSREGTHGFQRQRIQQKAAERMTWAQREWSTPTEAGNLMDGWRKRGHWEAVRHDGQGLAAAQGSNPCSNVF